MVEHLRWTKKQIALLFIAVLFTFSLRRSRSRPSYLTIRDVNSLFTTVLSYASVSSLHFPVILGGLPFLPLYLHKRGIHPLESPLHGSQTLGVCLVHPSKCSVDLQPTGWHT